MVIIVPSREAHSNPTRSSFSYLTKECVLSKITYYRGLLRPLSPFSSLIDFPPVPGVHTLVAEIRKYRLPEYRLRTPSSRPFYRREESLWKRGRVELQEFSF